jgi:hypothetical protein
MPTAYWRDRLCCTIVALERSEHGSGMSTISDAEAPRSVGKEARTCESESASFRKAPVQSVQISMSTLLFKPSS